jgi:hypothetical protein
VTTAASWYTQLTEGVNHYRAILPARHLPGKTVERSPWMVKRHWSGVGWEVPEQEGAAIWLFPGTTATALVMRELQTQGYPLMVEVDDLYFVPPPVHGLTHWERRYDGSDKHSYEIHRKIVPWVDGVTVSTERLAVEYRPWNPRVTVCPNAIDPDEWEPEPEHQPGGVLRVGWAASDSHAYDANLIDRALAWASQQDGVEVVIMGIELAQFSFPHRHIPFAPVLDYYRALQNIDVMLCPLKPSRWADCKSDIKAVEGAMAGAVPVVSRTEPYRPWWDGPAMVAETPKDYLKAVKYLAAHRDEARDMAAKAREYVLAERAFPAAVEPWREAVELAGRQRAAAAA